MKYLFVIVIICNVFIWFSDCVRNDTVIVDNSNETNLRTNSLNNGKLYLNINYYIKQTSTNNYLRWDGNRNGIVSGLTIKTESNINNINDTDKDLYLFKLEDDINGLYKVRNVRTNQYISSLTTTGYIILSNSTAYNNSIRLVPNGSSMRLQFLMMTDGYPYISATAGFIYTTAVSNWIYYMTRTNGITNFEFIEGPLSTPTPPQTDIGNTDLTFGSRYFIKLISSNNFLQHDGNSNSDGKGLRYILDDNATDIENQSIKNLYLFVFEPDVNSTIKIRNVATNLCISFSLNIGGFILSNNGANNSDLFRLLMHANNATINLLSPFSVSQYYPYLSPQSGLNIDSGLNLVYNSPSSGIASFQFIKDQSFIQPSTTTSITSTQTPSPTTAVTNTTAITTAATTTTTTTLTTPTTITTTLTTSTETAPALPKISLYAIISDFEYETPDDEEVRKRSVRLTLLPETVINNTNAGSISEKIQYNDEIEEKFKWIYYNINNLNLTIEEEYVTFPSPLQKSVEILNQDNSKQSSHLRDKRKFSYVRQYSIDRTLEIKPQSSVVYRAFAQYIVGLDYDFTALAEITGIDNNSNQLLTGNGVNEIIQTYGNFTVVNVSNKSVVIQVNGELTASFAKPFLFDVQSEQFTDS